MAFKFTMKIAVKESEEGGWERQKKAIQIELIYQVGHLYAVL